jgi:hypothetical protein
VDSAWHLRDEQQEASAKENEEITESVEMPALEVEG